MHPDYRSYEKYLDDGWSDSDMDDSDMDYSGSDMDEEYSDEYKEYSKDAFEFIKGIEEINLSQFPKIIVQKINTAKGSGKKFTKEQLISHMKLMVQNTLDTRLSILSEFLNSDLDQWAHPDDVKGVLSGLDDTDPSDFIVSLIDLERSLVKDASLKNILNSHPKVAYEIVKAYS